jgi:riboflavin synthase alpha subunit
VTVSGTQAQEESERTETEFEGQVTAIDGMTLTVAGRTITATSATVVREKGTAVAFDALKVGSPVEVEGSLQADGSVLARRICIENERPGDGRVSLVGTLDVIDGSKLTVGGLGITLSSNTEIFRGETKIDPSALKLGDRLLVRGQVQSDQSIAASVIRVLVAEDEEQAFHVTGAVTAISLEQQTFTIGETVIAVDAQTKFDGRLGAAASLADLRIGDKVDAEAVKRADGSLLAKGVHSFRPPPPPSPSVMAQGPIEALGTSSVTVAGTQFPVTAQTIIHHGAAAVPFSELKLGQSVVVKGAPVADGSLVAETIEVVLVPMPLPKLLTVKGAIGAIGSDSVTVLGIRLQVDAHTLILRGDTVVPLSNLRVGEAAQVSGKIAADKSKLALVIRVAT